MLPRFPIICSQTKRHILYSFPPNSRKLSLLPKLSLYYEDTLDYDYSRLRKNILRQKAAASTSRIIENMSPSRMSSTLSSGSPIDYEHKSSTLTMPASGRSPYLEFLNLDLCSDETGHALSADASTGGIGAPSQDTNLSFAPPETAGSHGDSLSSSIFSSQPAPKSPTNNPTGPASSRKRSLPEFNCRFENMLACEPNQEPVQKKPRACRAHKACDQCRQRKVKCVNFPNCDRCLKIGVKCTFNKNRQQSVKRGNEKANSPKTADSAAQHLHTSAKAGSATHSASSPVLRHEAGDDDAFYGEVKQRILEIERELSRIRNSTSGWYQCTCVRPIFFCQQKSSQCDELWVSGG
ncbi:hypothetical protein BC936DRAFT_137646 [Jimgerdemannia flammicorona]|uniref:Zn(2)-C6 fungal-type domain-containing protein n=1 Tax=Jimgerdemannia flammicorona TaxID=994334 RepID=A0A433DJ98_9FUNG|nr:hypothetical protein BC936DRAFT_137646 [Jimgerdemannia flammicorona]